MWVGSRVSTLAVPSCCRGRPPRFVAAPAFLVAVLAASMSCAPRMLSKVQGSNASDASALAIHLAEALAEACPVSRPDDLNAKGSCASKLANLPILRERMSEPFLWGTQTRTTSYDFEDGRTTRFNPLVWRKMYLSLEMFAGTYRIERVADTTILRMATRFRSELDPGDYPYPFWHSTAKWESYEFALETLFVIVDGKIIGALRSADYDRSRPALARTFDGNWNWVAEQGGRGPSVALYRRLFSPSNLNVAPLDRAFRAFEAESRQYNCAGCHRPDNPAGQRQLEMFCYPNQALASRHTIVRAIEDNRMPPPSLPGTPSGIADEHKRHRLLELAREFETVADAALRAEPSNQEP